MCEYQSLYFNDDGYVIRCKQCGHYQLAFSSTLLVLTDDAFHDFCKLVKFKCAEMDCSASGYSKSLVLPTPSPGVCMLLTRTEVSRFGEILEVADNEMKALTLISMFNVDR